MMKNKITDLNNHLFAQLERLGEEDLSDDDLQKEISRSRAITDIAGRLVESAKVTVDAMKIMEKAGQDIRSHGQNLLGAKDDNGRPDKEE